MRWIWAAATVMAVVAISLACNPGAPGEAVPTPASPSGAAPGEAPSGDSELPDWIEDVDPTSVPVLLSALMDDESYHQALAVLADEMRPGWRERLEEFSEEDWFLPDMLELERKLVDVDVSQPLSEMQLAFIEYSRRNYQKFQNEYQKRIDAEPRDLGKAAGERKN